MYTEIYSVQTYKFGNICRMQFSCTHIYSVYNSVDKELYSTYSSTYANIFHIPFRICNYIPYAMSPIPSARSTPPVTSSLVARPGPSLRS